MPIVSFKVKHEGRTYECEREIEGKRRLTQRTRVIGVGAKEDSAVYGQNERPIVSMESIARVIAHEIIRQPEVW